MRLSGVPHIFVVDYVQPNQLAAGQGYESIFALYPLIIAGQSYATGLVATHLNTIRSINPNIVLIGYLDPMQDSLPDSTGPGYDAMQYLEGIESAYLHDANGKRLLVPGAQEVCNGNVCNAVAYFNPASVDVQNAVVAAVKVILAAYPFDGMFFDNYDVQGAMLLDTTGAQYLGTAGQVYSAANAATMLTSITTLAGIIRAAFPTILIEANGDNAFPLFNGEMVELTNQISRVPGQAAVIPGRVTPFIPLFEDVPVSGPTDPIIAADMAYAQSFGTWYGAQATYEIPIWPTAFTVPAKMPRAPANLVAQ